MSFSNAILTNGGRVVTINGLGGGAIKFTKLKIGSGKLAKGKDSRELTDLILPVAEAPIVKFVKKSHGIKVVASFQNAFVADEFYWSEVGLYVQDPQDPNKEILYAYQNAGDKAEYITPLNMVTRNISINIIIDDTDGITAEQHRELVFATLEDLDDVVSCLEETNDRIDHHIKNPNIHIFTFDDEGRIICKKVYDPNYTEDINIRDVTREDIDKMFDV